MANISINISVNSAQVNRELNSISAGVNRMGNNINNTVARSGESFKGMTQGLLNLKTAVVGLAVAGFGLLAKNVYDVTSSFEKYNAILKNSLGSQNAANVAMQGLQDFAANTPFSLDQITASYIKLVNRGIAPTKQELTSLGDFTAKSGKDFDQLSEAILDIGNQERWKEFGVVAQKAGNKLKLTFNGVTKEVDYTVQGAKQAISEFGKMDGVAGLMAEQSLTLGGIMSNLGDTFDQISLAIGSKLSPIIKPLLKQFGELANNAIPYINYGITKAVEIFGYLKDQFMLIVNSPIGTFFKNQLGAQFEYLKNVLGIVVNVFNTLRESFFNFINNFPIVTRIFEGVMSVFNNIRGAMLEMIKLITGITGIFINFLTSGFVGKIVSALYSPFAWLIEKIGQAYGFIKDLLSKINKYLGFDTDLGNISMGVEGGAAGKLAQKGLGGNNISFDELQSLLTTKPTSNNTSITGASSGNKLSGESVTGGQTRSIVLNIGNVVENQYFSPNDNPLKVAKMVEKALVAVLADTTTLQ